MTPFHPNRHSLGLAVSAALSVAPVGAGAASAQLPATVLDPIVVTAQPARDESTAEQALTPGGVTVLDGDELYERSVTNLPDLLRYAPGVWAQSSTGGDELFFSSRGSNLDATDFDKNGIKLLVDGLPVTTADGNNHNRVLDPLTARYATIARGANALAYGASTLGGAIDFVTPTARNTEPLSLFLTGGSDGLFNGRLSAGAMSGPYDGLVTVEKKSYDGYRDHSKLDREGLYANAGWQMSDAVTTRFYATYVNYDEELPRALTRAQIDENPDQAAASAITGDNRKRLETARGAFKTNWQIDASSSLQFGASYEKQALYHPIVDVRGDLDGDGFPETQFFSLLIDTDHRNIGGMIRYGKQLGAHDLLLGLNYADTEVDGGNYRNLFGRKNGLSQRVSESAESYELFAIDRWKLAPAWTLVYGAQFVDTRRDVRVVEASDGAVRNPKADYSSINPRLGAIYAVNQTSQIFANLSRLFEAPTTFEMTDDVRGDDRALDAMKGVVAEIGTRGATTVSARTTWHWDVAIYYAKIDDEILSVDDPDEPGTSLATNIDSTIHAGLEALVGASFAVGEGTVHRIAPLLSLTVNEFSFDADPVYGNNDLPAAPRYALRGELIYRSAKGFYAGPTFDLIGRRYADFANTYRVGAYQLLGLRGGYQARRWEVFAELRNLTDEDYIATVGVRDRAAADADVLFPGAPLSAFVGMRASF